jgi:hypothetical protein
MELFARFRCLEVFLKAEGKGTVNFRETTVVKGTIQSKITVVKYYSKAESHD